MEGGDVCDMNQLDGGVLLPPRKRLLAGFKKQATCLDPVTFAAAASTSSSCETSIEVDAHLDNLLTCHLNDANLTPEQIAETSRSAAIVAAKAAKAARAAAEEKAVIAAKAVAAAKSALDLVASFSEQQAVDGERYPKKNKLKKHVPVELLYTKPQQKENCGTDEELADKFHRAVNSSGRTSKTSSSSERNSHVHKKSKNSAASEKSGILNGCKVLGGSLHPICNGHSIAGKVNCDSSNGEVGATKADETEHEKCSRLKSDKSKAIHSTEKPGEGTTSSARKRGRLKKGLPEAVIPTLMK